MRPLIPRHRRRRIVIDLQHFASLWILYNCSIRQRPISCRASNRPHALQPVCSSDFLLQSVHPLRARYEPVQLVVIARHVHLFWGGGNPCGLNVTFVDVIKASAEQCGLREVLWRWVRNVDLIHVLADVGIGHAVILVSDSVSWNALNILTGGAEYEITTSSIFILSLKRVSIFSAWPFSTSAALAKPSIYHIPPS